MNMSEILPNVMDSSSESESDSSESSFYENDCQIRSENNESAGVHFLCFGNDNNLQIKPDTNALTSKDAKWSTNYEDTPKFQFSGPEPGLKLQQHHHTPSDFADIFFNYELLNIIVKETNRCVGHEIAKQHPLQETSPLRHWKPITVEEMKIFLGLLLQMGPCSLPTIKHYWNTNILYNLPYWRNMMDLQRFKLVFRYLRFSNHTLATTKIMKTEPLIEHFNKTMIGFYNPKKELCLSEPLTLVHGRFLPCSYLKDKSNELHLYELCESQGTVLKMQLTADNCRVPTNEIQSSEIVLGLLEKYSGKGYILYTDNYYNSTLLARILTKCNTYVCGPIKCEKSTMPTELLEKNLKKDDYFWMRSDKTIVSKWRSKEDIYYISNMHQFEMINEQKKQKTISKPNIVRDYENGKIQIDRSAQLFSYYTALRKDKIPWYKKVALHVMETFIHNAYILYLNQSNAIATPLSKFRDCLVIHLIGTQLPSNLINLTVGTPDFHYLETIPPTNKKEKPSRVCRMCKINKKRRETRYMCAVCEEKPPLCVERCFRDYHSAKQSVSLT